MVKVQCICGRDLTVLQTDRGKVITQHCDFCAIYAYALGFVDGGVPNAEKITYATIMANRRTVRF